ncbi:caspase family protein [Limnohabitans sp.]|uniref:caspase family protein n=1 Tax=Limnohabitans sp. TaxID=1907725 RepID=UPI002FDCA031
MHPYFAQFKSPRLVQCLAITALAFASVQAVAQTMTVLRATELKADRFIDAASLGQLSAGQSVESIKIEAGWIQIKSGDKTGWVRSLALKGSNTAQIASASSLDSGRSGNNNSMSTTGIRSVPKASRHALIIGIGEYSVSGVSPLKGVTHDMQSAKVISQAMSIPEENITYLRDGKATASEIRRSIQDLEARVRPGDRVFVYYSGHGTRWLDTSKPNSGQCMEGLLASDGNAVTNTEMSDLLSPIAKKTDKLMVFYDSCHSGGIANQPLRTRSLNLYGTTLTPKFSNLSLEACAKPSNMRTRAISAELGSKGIFPENIVSIAASRPDEVSFDNPLTGGMATVAWRDCMLGKAKDLDQSGSLSVEEITSCAQANLNQSLANQQDILGQHMTIGGNKAFIPSFQVASIAPEPVAPTQTTPVPLATAAPTNNATPSVLTSTTPSLPQPSLQAVKPNQLLAQIHAQRDASRKLSALANPQRMRILQDPLRLKIQSERAGYVYVALAGSDQKSLYLLFPNSLDGNNRIEANQSIELPKSGWRVTAAGPKGVNTVLVLVSDSPRDLSQLDGENAGPFLKTLLNAEGKSKLQWLLANSENQDQNVCQTGGAKRNLAVSQDCSDGFASALVEIEEVEAK